MVLFWHKQQLAGRDFLAIDLEWASDDSTFVSSAMNFAD